MICPITVYSLLNEDKNEYTGNEVNKVGSTIEIYPSNFQSESLTIIYIKGENGSGEYNFKEVHLLTVSFIDKLISEYTTTEGKCSRVDGEQQMENDSSYISNIKSVYSCGILCNNDNSCSSFDFGGDHCTIYY